MSTLLKRMSLLLISLLLANSCFAESAEQMAQSVLQKSGLIQQIQSIPTGMQAGFTQGLQKSGASKAMREQLNQDLLTSFDPARMQLALSAALSQNLTPEAMQSVLTWLDSPLGQKISSLETAASKPEAEKSAVTFTKQLQQHPMADSRMSLYKQLDAATKASDSAVQIGFQLQLTILSALNAAHPKAKKMPFDKLIAALNAQKETISAMIKQSAFNAFLYTYHTLSDEELNTYLNFAKSQAGITYHSVTSEVLSKSIQTASRDFGMAMAKTLKPATQPTPSH